VSAADKNNEAALDK